MLQLQQCLQTAQGACMVLQVHPMCVCVRVYIVPRTCSCTLSGGNEVPIPPSAVFLVGLCVTMRAAISWVSITAAVPLTGRNMIYHAAALVVLNLPLAPRYCRPWHCLASGVVHDNHGALFGSFWLLTWWKHLVCVCWPAHDPMTELWPATAMRAGVAAVAPQQRRRPFGAEHCAHHGSMY